MKEIKTSTMDVEKLVKSIDSGKFSRDIPWQRMDGLYDNYQRSLLIDTTMRDFKIPAIWITKTATENFDRNSIIDGVQRTTTLYNYIKNKFSLHKDLKPVTVTVENADGTIEEKTFEIAGKKFKQLPDYLQSKINDYNLSFIEMFGYTDDEIEEQFFRLNNYAVFTKFQRIKVILGTQLAEKINTLEKLPFWSRTAYSPKQRKDGKITATVMQCLMLLTGYDYKNLEANEIEKFAVWYSENYNNKDIEYLKELINKLDEYMIDSDENNKFLKKINIPALIMNVDRFLSLEDESFTSENYSQFLDEWVSGNAYNSGYINNCGQGSTGSGKVKNRINIIDEWLDAYVQYTVCGEDFSEFIKEHSIVSEDANDDDSDYDSDLYDDNSNSDVDRAFSVFNGMNKDFAAMVDSV